MTPDPIHPPKVASRGGRHYRRQRSRNPKLDRRLPWPRDYFEREPEHGSTPLGRPELAAIPRDGRRDPHYQAE